MFRWQLSIGLLVMLLRQHRSPEVIGIVGATLLLLDNALLLVAASCQPWATGTLRLSAAPVRFDYYSVNGFLVGFGVVPNDDGIGNDLASTLVEDHAEAFNYR